MNEKRIPVYSYIIRGALLGALLGPTIFLIPFIGPLLSLPLFPLMEIYDSVIPGEFMFTGKHVEYGFMWISLKTNESYIFFASFFAYIGAITGLLIRVFKFLPRKAILGILITIILLCFSYLYKFIR